MNEVSISSLEQYINLTTAAIPKGHFFRGLSDTNHALIPPVGRYWPDFEKLGHSYEFFLEMERASIQMFLRYLMNHEKSHPHNTFDLLAIAQHHGLPTRLQDWSGSPMVALYFAVRSLSPKDGAVHMFDGSLIALNDHDLLNMDPFNIDKDYIVIPRGVSKRIIPQSGFFVLQKTAHEPFSHNSLRKLIIPKEMKRPLVESLWKLGLFDAMLFPDLDGAAKEIAFVKFGKV